MLPPVMVSLERICFFFYRCITNIREQTKVIDKHPLSWLEFTEDAIITSCKNGTFPRQIALLTPVADYSHRPH